MGNNMSIESCYQERHLFDQSNNNSMGNRHHPMFPIVDNRNHINSGITTEGIDEQDFDEFCTHVAAHDQRLRLREKRNANNSLSFQETIPGEDSKFAESYGHSKTKTYMPRVGMQETNLHLQIPNQELQASPRRMTGGENSSRPTSVPQKVSETVQVDSRDIMKNIFYI